MTVKLARLVYWLCTLWLIVLPIGALYLLADIQTFASFAASNLRQPIHWVSVTGAQWYGLWLLTALYMSIGYIGIVFLRRAFASFAKGEWFDTRNSKSLRSFAILLIGQGVAKPVHFTLSSILLSLHHSAGEKVLAVSFGSNELILIGAGLTLWVLSDLLVTGMRAEAENRQIV